MALDRRRALGIGLLAGGLIATGILLAALPLPREYEDWAGGGEGGTLLIARGPAIARYDPATDTTIAVFECGHWPCQVATQVAGNATETVARSQVVLFAPNGLARGDVDITPPIVIRDGPANVTSMTAARFEIGRAWLPVLLYQLAFLAVVVGVPLVSRAGDRIVLASALGAGAGMFAGAQLVGPAMLVVGPLLLFGLTALVAAGGAVLLLGPWRARGAAWGAAALAFAAALVFSLVVAARFFSLEAPL